ncbi:hypothetical protein [Streptosporangium jomthongense]|uniref:Uncharacterized protein n=1 Tax=Streptosporangium jomthongense TaxID=1193683 RepID=A0ABV8F4W3_9ACTN
MFDWLGAALFIALLVAAIAWPLLAVVAAAMVVGLRVSAVRRRRAGQPAAWRTPAWWGRACVAAFLLAATGAGVFVQADESFGKLDADDPPRCPVGADCVPSTFAEMAAHQKAVQEYALAGTVITTVAGLACLGICVTLLLRSRRHRA